MGRAKSLLDTIGTVFGFSHEKIPGEGEDSWCCRIHERGGIIAVFDGCGGLGAETYARLSGKTGAYLASRAAAAATMDWFDAQPIGELADVATLKPRLQSMLRVCAECAQQPRAKLRGAMVRPMPTTIAAVEVQLIDQRAVATLVCAGDSRVYLLDSSGLKQMSRDDVAGEDAFTNLYHDAPMTNVVSLDGQYELSHASYELTRECILLAATDGCFGYLKSPMEFEMLLLETLMQSNSIDEWQDSLEREIDAVAGDDQTLVALVYGYETFDELKASLALRTERLYSLLASLQDHVDARRAVWERYKEEYYALALGGVPRL